MLTLAHRVRRKLFSWILEFAQQAEQVQRYWHSVLKRLISQKFHVSVAGRFVAKIDIGSAENENFLWYARTPVRMAIS